MIRFYTFIYICSLMNINLLIQYVFIELMQI